MNLFGLSFLLFILKWLAGKVFEWFYQQFLKIRFEQIDVNFL